MRAVDHLVRNYPHRLTNDPYASPDAQYVGIAPLFDLTIATIALTIGLGSPSTAVVEWVGALTPPLAGALAIVLVFLLARRVFGPRAGLIAATLVTAMPGHFLDRTILGVADHHAGETVLVLLTLLLATAASTAAAEPAPSSRWDRRVAPWLAGVSLGAYFLTWTSAALFAAALSAWLVVQVTIDLARSRDSRYLTSITIRMGLVALALVGLVQDSAMFRYNSQVAALAGFVLLGVVWHALESARLRGWIARRTIVVGTATAAAAAAGLAAWLFPELRHTVTTDLARFEPNAAGRSVAETRPLFSTERGFSFAAPLRVFGTTFYLAVPALAALAVRVIRHGRPGDSLLLVWGAIAFVATIGQNRFGYYLAPILAILGAWACSFILDRAERVRTTGDTSPPRWRTDLAVVILAAAVFYPSIRPGIESIRRDEGLPPAWHEALTWMREHTPEPFGEPATYVARYDRAALPQPAYSVMAWWDYGYWITRVGRRVPVANPTQARAGEAARFFVAQTEADAFRAAAAERSRYVIVDRDLVFLPTPTRTELRGKFQNLALWAGQSPGRYFDPMFERLPDGRLTPAWVFYPEYYQSMAVRLYLFGAAAVEPDNATWVISYAERLDAARRPYREITQSKRLATFAAAQDYLRGLGPGPHRIVGRNPLQSPIPLPALTGVKLVHETGTNAGIPPEVRVFELVPP